MEKLNLSNKYIKIIFAFVVATAFITIYCHSSPIYPMNEWEDVHCFFTMGRGIIHGQVMYKDLYEQKGPILYLIFAVIALISEKSFIGMYLIELFGFFAFLYFAGKTMELYTNNSLIPYVGVLMLSYITISSPAFAIGGSVEELNFSFLTISLYLLIKNIRKGVKIENNNSLLIGMFAGFAFWTKFIICGLYLGEVLFVIIYYIANKYSAKDFWLTVFVFLLGVCLISMPVLVYCLLTNSLLDMLETYVYNNMFIYNLTYNAVYGNVNFGMISSQIIAFFKRVFNSINSNMIFNKYVLLSLGVFICWFKKYKYESLLVILSFACLAFGTFIGGQSFPYYGLSFAIFAVFGLVFVFNVVDILLAKINIKKIYIYAPVFVLVILITINNIVSYSVLEYSKQKKEDMVQYKYAEIINTIDNPRVLNYHFLDGGFYYAAGVLPNCKYFVDFSIDVDAIIDVVEEMIANKDFDFIIDRDETLENVNYKLIDETNYRGHNYYLYQLVQ